jgi:adenosylcobinamide-phosphate guanylyltransferase
MDALVMCGGRGTRLDADVEKPLYRIDGRPMIDRVRDALAASHVDTTQYVVSPHTPRTRERLAGDLIDAPGDGYVADLQYALERTGLPVLTVATDLPLLAGDAIDTVLERHDGGSLTVSVPVALKRLLGVSVGTTMEVDGEAVAPSGVNVVSETDADDTIVTHDVRFAVNVNRQSDGAVAEQLL